VDDFAVKDSGERMEFDSGMVRDTSEDKTDFGLIYDGPMLNRWAIHLSKGAKKYAPRNWMLASGVAEYIRFKASAARHFYQWFVGARDEDHAAAVFFNINGAEYVQAKMKARGTDARRNARSTRGTFLVNRDPGDETDES
jgi:hypothetical protein